MVLLKKYNPCEEYIKDLTGVISQKIISNKKVVIKYDKALFITNLKETDIADFSIDDANVYYNDKGLCIIDPLEHFFIEGIKTCPSFDFIEINDLELCGIIKRMYAQIEFGYYNEEDLSQQEIILCDYIFKAIYTNSVSIKHNQLQQCIAKYNELQCKDYVNKKVIDGIIYAAYDLYNSLNQ